MESMVPVCDKRYHIYNRFRHFWAEIKKLWNYPLRLGFCNTEANRAMGFFYCSNKYRYLGDYYTCKRSKMIAYLEAVYALLMIRY